MNPEVVTKKFLGSNVGHAVGDTVGAPLEFWDKDRIPKHPQGTEWVDDLLPFAIKKKHFLWVWVDDAPTGTATDDTRLNQVFVEAVIKYGTVISSKLLAAEYIDRYINRDKYYPDYPEFSTLQFRGGFASGCGLLDMECPIRPGIPPSVLRSKSGGGGFPSLSGLLRVPAAGLLHPGDPEAAYRHAFELTYDDIGYAKDATALLAAMVACGFIEDLSPREAIRRGLETDPFNFGERRTMIQWLNRFLEMADEVDSDRELVIEVSKAVAERHPYDPIDVLGMPVAAAYRANGEPRRSILMSVNDRDFDENGEFEKFRDTDCTGSVCGALVGALTPGGIDDFPADWVAPTISANREVYGFDLEVNARRMCEVIASGK